MQLVHDGSKSCDYFCKSVDYALDQSVKKSRNKNQEIEIKEESYRAIVEPKRLCLVASTEYDSQQWLKKEYIEALDNKKNILIVIVDYFRDSMISQKYIQERLFRGNNDTAYVMENDVLPEILLVEYCEQNDILRIEDTYDHTFSYNRLSRSYKKSLRQVIRFFEQPEELPKKSKKTLRRKAYADRSMV